MAINVSFNGATIYKPGSYSKTSIDLGGGFPLGATGIVAIFGEAAAGAPGSEENVANNAYTPDQLSQIREKYRSGPIVDAATFAFAPAADAAIPSGAQALYIYKTNASTRAQLALSNSYGTLKSVEWGEGGNRITYKAVGVAEVPAAHSGSVNQADGADIGMGLVLSLAAEGAAPISHTIPASADKTALLADLEAAFPAFNFTLPAGATAKLGIALAPKPNHHRDGYERSFEILAGSAVAYFGLSVGLKFPSVAPSKMVTVSQKRDLINEDASIGGNVVIRLGFNSSDNAASSASVSIDSNNVILSVVGGADAAVLSLPKSAYGSLSELVADINLKAGWSASMASTLAGQLSLDILDQVSAIGALSEAGLKPAGIKKDAAEMEDFLALSSLVYSSDLAQCGLPDDRSEISLAGGSKGGTSTASIMEALDVLTKPHVNAVVPLFSRDASADMADNLTDAASTYTIDGIHQAVKTHLSLTASTKKRSERQGYLSLKKDYAAVKEKAAEMAYERIQLLFQDVRQQGSDGVIKFFQPWALATMLAGARAGSSVGLPMTFKYLNMSGIRHTAQPMSTPEESIVEEFDPDLQYDDAIQAGLTFVESPQSGGFRVVVDNTTYGKDANWVKNRGNVMYAADVLVWDFRNQLENLYVGTKNTINATEVKSVCASILDTYLSQGITVRSDDAPNGYKALSVRIEGNIIYISVTVTLVEGIDFVLIDLTVSRKQSAA